MLQARLKNPPFGIKALVHVLVGILSFTVLFGSLLLINVFQIASLCLLPFSRRSFRKVNRCCANTWWGLCVVSSENVARIQPVITGDDVPIRENAIVVANHQQMPDIIALFMLAWRKKRLGDMKWFVKDVLKYVPGIGWGMLFLDCLFVKRNWSEDEDKIHNTFSKFLSEDIPIWLTSFSEGTRITGAKLEKSQDYARRENLPVPEHVLIPRTKGFVASVHGLKGHIHAIYDVTIGYPDGIPSLWQYLKGMVGRVHMRVRRFAIEELPSDPSALSHWLLVRFQEKDRLLEYFVTHGAFPT